MRSLKKSKLVNSSFLLGGEGSEKTKDRDEAIGKRGFKGKKTQEKKVRGKRESFDPLK